MFSKKVCELVMVIDRSGSMSSCKSAVIEGMNELIAKQRNIPGRCNLTTVLFDHEYLPQHTSADLQGIGYMDDTHYVPRGMTALWDAVGRTIENAKARFIKSKPDQVICVIVTDGIENASKEFTLEQVKKEIEKSDWEFVFIGANQDAVLTAKSIGIPSHHAMNYNATPLGTRQAYDGTSSIVGNLRSNK